MHDRSSQTGVNVSIWRCEDLTILTTIVINHSYCVLSQNSSSWESSSACSTHLGGDSLSSVPTDSPDEELNDLRLGLEPGLDLDPTAWQEVRLGMDQLRKELGPLLKGKGKDAEAVLRRLDQLKDSEKVSGSSPFWC